MIKARQAVELLLTFVVINGIHVTVVHVTVYLGFFNVVDDV